MFFLRSILAALVCAGAAGSALAAEILPGPIPATVVRLIDGDTVEVRARIWLDQDVTTEVRLAGVDAPETRSLPCAAHREPGLAATGFVAGLGLGAVTLAEIEQDKYGGRVVARLFLADGRDLSALLLEEGLAWPYGAEDPLCAPPARGPGPAED